MPNVIKTSCVNAAIAPNANSSIIAGTSPSIEPWKSNAYTHRTRVGSYLVKNPHLEKVLDQYYKDLKINWHFIGNIQSNKCEEIAKNFDWIHTIDRLKIAKDMISFIENKIYAKTRK